MGGWATDRYLAERWSNEFNRSDIRNLAILVIDIPSNQVVAYCGNVHFDRKQGGNQVDVISYLLQEVVELGYSVSLQHGYCRDIQ